MKQANEAAALEAVSLARTALVLDHPFFGQLALRLKPVIDVKCHTAWTDGISLGVNPDRFLALTDAQRIGLLAHEVMHCTNGHPWREGGRDHKTWNKACDMAINPILVGAGFQLPEGALMPSADQNDAAAESIYSALVRDEQKQNAQGEGDDQQQGGDQQEAGDPGETRKPGEAGEGDDQQSAQGAAQDDAQGDAQQQVDIDALEHEWQTAVQQAQMMCKMRGSMPGDVSEAIEKANQAKIDWAAELRKFVQQVAKDDYTWRRPNSRYQARGLYMPALHSEALGPIVLAIDTSASVSSAEVAAFMAEVEAIVAECKPEYTLLIQADARVNHVDRIERGDDFQAPKVYGRGGTDFRPVFAHVEADDVQPACLIYLTDLEGQYPPQAPEYPVLWACTTNLKATWGETIQLDVHR